MALASDPRNRRARAFVAWLEFWKPSTDRDAQLPEATKMMEEAVFKDRQFGYGYYFLGALQQMANDAGAATRSFTAAVCVDSSIVEARRELRRLAARRTSGGHR
jgi:hypothetical protein